MSTAELKLSLHQLIDRTENSTILKSVYAILTKFTLSTATSLTKAEKKAVDEALKSIQNGNSFSHEQVMAEMKQRYPALVK